MSVALAFLVGIGIGLCLIAGGVLGMLAIAWALDYADRRGW